MAASYTPTGEDEAYHPGMCRDRKSNRQPFGARDDAQPPEPHGPGLPVL